MRISSDGPATKPVMAIRNVQRLWGNSDSSTSAPAIAKKVPKARRNPLLREIAHASQTANGHGKASPIGFFPVQGQGDAEGQGHGQGGLDSFLEFVILHTAGLF